MSDSDIKIHLLIRTIKTSLTARKHFTSSQVQITLPMENVCTVKYQFFKQPIGNNSTCWLVVAWIVISILYFFAAARLFWIDFTWCSHKALGITSTPQIIFVTFSPAGGNPIRLIDLYSKSEIFHSLKFFRYKVIIMWKLGTNTTHRLTFE